MPLTLSSRPCRRVAAGLAVAAALAASAAQARAATYCVNKPACPGGTAVPDLEAAEAKANTNAGPDRVEIGPGLYTGVKLGFGPEKPVALVGSGAGATILQGADVVDLSSAGSEVADLTVRVTSGVGIDSYEPTAVHDVMVHDAGAPDNATGILMRGGGSLARVRVAMNTTSAIPSEGVTLAPVPGGPASPAATLTDVEISAAWGLRIAADTAPHGTVALRRVRARGTTLGAWFSGRADVHGEQVVLRATNTSAAVGAGYGSSLELSGDKGVPTVALRHATIARVADRGEAVSILHTRAEPMRLSLRDSLVLGVGASARDFSVQSSAAPVVLSLDHSAWRASGLYFPYASQARAQFTIGAGNVDLDRSPAAVRNAGAGDFRPGAGSALVDNGSREPLAPAESPLDALGAPRLVDGDRDGLAARDIGALEAAAGTSPAHVVPVLHGAPADQGGGGGGQAGDEPSAVAILSGLRARAARRGVRVRFVSSAPAQVRLQLRRCVRWRARKGCLRYGRATTARVPARVGENRVRLGSKRLRHGRYRVSAEVVGTSAKPRSVPLRIRRR